MKDKKKKKPVLARFGKNFPKLTKVDSRKLPKRIEGGYIWAG